MLKRLARGDAVRIVSGRLIGLYLRLALRSTRWTVEAPAESWPFMLGDEGRTAIVAFWHEFLPLIPALWWHAHDVRPDLKMTVLISRHRDGRMITGIVRRWGVDAVAGSSDRAKPGSAATRDKGGAAALRHLLGLIRCGSLIAITPDGPRGPRRVLQPGVARLAALSGVPVIAAACLKRPHQRIGSWDRMILPLPFGRGTIVCSAPIAVPSQGWADVLPAISAALDEVSLAVGA
jgi:3-deoxy-D-manno-octulosonic-acid transferase